MPSIRTVLVKSAFLASLCVSVDYSSAADVAIEERGGVTMATNLRGGLVDGLMAANLTAAEAEKGSGRWYWFAGGAGADPGNLVDMGNNTLSLTVRPEWEVTRIVGNTYYTGGKLEVRVKSAANTPGIVTSIYLTSGNGRTSDEAPGQQDELDLEWRGVTPRSVQSNIFLKGEQDPLMTDVGGDSSVKEPLYAIEWNNKQANFSVNGTLIRSKPTGRMLKPMRLEISVWTTHYGAWPGLTKWAGEMDWNARGWAPATATFQILSFPRTNVSIAA